MLISELKSTYTATLYLDKRTKKGNDTCQVKIGIHCHGASGCIPTGLWIKPSAWDPLRKRVIKLRSVQTALNGMHNRVTALLLKLSAEGKLYGKTATQVKNIVMRCLDPNPTTDNIYDRMLEYARHCHAPRTRKLFLTTAKKLLAFNPHIRTMPLASITRSWVTAFDHFMLPARPNTRAIDLRDIRTVINSIIDGGVDCPYPFRTFKLPSEPARHRTPT